jgi:hypothetical protein
MATGEVKNREEHAFFHDCDRGGRQARAVVAVTTLFESRELRLFDQVRTTFSAETVSPILRRFQNRPINPMR